MGRMKKRQGVSVNLGLRRNKTFRVPFIFGRKGADKEVLAEKKRMGWLAATLAAITRPFRSVNNKFQSYRRKV